MSVMRNFGDKRSALSENKLIANAFGIVRRQLSVVRCIVESLLDTLTRLWRELIGIPSALSVVSCPWSIVEKNRDWIPLTICLSFFGGSLYRTPHAHLPTFFSHLFARNNAAPTASRSYRDG